MALNIISNVQLDMKAPNTVIVYANQYDSAGSVRAQLLNSGESWSVPAGAKAVVMFKKSDNIGGFYDVTEFGVAAVEIDSDRSVIYINYDPQVLTTAGRVAVQINFYQNDQRLSSFAFYTDVQASAVTSGEIASSWLFNILSQEIAQTLTVATTPQAMTDWLEANITQETGYVIDNTLTVAGAASDAQATGKMVTVSDLNPNIVANKVWVKKTPATIDIPTCEEVDELSRQISDIEENQIPELKSTTDKYDSPFIESTNNPLYTSGITKIMIIDPSVAIYSDYRIRSARHNTSWHLYMNVQGYNDSSWVSIDAFEIEYSENTIYPRIETLISKNEKLCLVMDWNYAYAAYSDSSLDIRLKPTIAFKPYLDIKGEIANEKDITGYNLVNTNNILSGALQANGSVENASRGIEELVTDFITVSPETLYVLQVWETNASGSSYFHRINYYDSNKSVIDTVTAGAATVRYSDYMYRKDFITTPSNCAFIRIGYRSYGNGMVQLEKGSITTAYTPGIKSLENSQSYNNAGRLMLKSIAHRGGGENGSTPENTTPAFIWGKQQGFPIVETDVSWTSDGVPVLLHDASINRTARNADGTAISQTVNIADITYEQALTYDFGIYKGEEYAGTKILTLEEFVVLCRNIDLMAYIEIKPSPILSEAMIKDIVNLVKTYGMERQVSWISSSYQCLWYVKKYDPSARLGLIASSYTYITLNRLKSLINSENEVMLDAEVSIIDSNLVSACKNMGAKLEAYTPNTSSAMLALGEYVSGATSDCLIFADVIKDSIIQS